MFREFIKALNCKLDQVLTTTQTHKGQLYLSFNHKSNFVSIVMKYKRRGSNLKLDVITTEWSGEGNYIYVDDRKDMSPQDYLSKVIGRYPNITILIDIWNDVISKAYCGKYEPLPHKDDSNENIAIRYVKEVL